MSIQHVSGLTVRMVVVIDPITLAESDRYLSFAAVVYLLPKIKRPLDFAGPCVPVISVAGWGLSLHIFGLATIENESCDD